MKNNVFKGLAAFCFAAMAIWDIVDLFILFDFWSIVTSIGCILVVISLLTDTIPLSIVGLALLTFYRDILFVINADYITATTKNAFSSGTIPFQLLLWIVTSFIYTILTLASITPKCAKPFGIIASVLAVIRITLIVARNIAEGSETSIGFILWGMLLAISAALLGFALDGIAKRSKKAATAHSTSGCHHNQLVSIESNADKLLKLKMLLDNDVITLKEFNDKKRQLLDL